MISTRHFRGLCFAGAILSAAVSAQASRLGHPGYSTKGATAAENQYNIICDPAYAMDGTTTTQYTANFAELIEVTPLQDFSVTEVLVQYTSPASDVTNLYPFFPDAAGNVHISLPAGDTPTGYAQTKWTNNSTSPGGDDSSDAPTDDNTHQLIFKNIATDPNQVAMFMDYGDPGVGNMYLGPDGTQHEGVLPADNADAYTVMDPDTHTPVTYTGAEIDGPGNIETVFTPEPTSAGIIAAAAVAGLLRRKRRALV